MNSDIIEHKAHGANQNQNQVQYIRKGCKARGQLVRAEMNKYVLSFCYQERRGPC